MITHPVLTRPSDGDLVSATEQCLFALFRAMAGTLPDAETVETEQLSRHLSFPSNPMFKGAWGTRLASDAVDDAIDEVIAWFTARNAPFFFWWTGPSTQPEDLGSRLEARGLLSMEQTMAALTPGMVQSAAGAPSMVADLNEVNEALLNRTPPGFEIEQVADAQSLQDWKHVVVTTYELPDWAGQAWVDATTALGLDRTPWRFYLGRLDGEAVASNLLFLGGGFAMIMAVATLPEAQHQGIGSAISLKPLLDARAAGYRYATLWSTEEGVPVYQRIGFRDTGARINRYLWRNSA